MSEYKMKTGKLSEKVVDAYKKIEGSFVDTFLNEDGSMKTGNMAGKASSAYQKIEDTVVGGYKKVEEAFVDTFLEKVEDEESEVKKETKDETNESEDKKK